MYFLHPIVVHFAIALLSVAVVCDFLYLITKKENFWQITNYLLVAGTLSAIGAVLTGNQAFKLIEVTPEIEALVNDHHNSGQLAMWVFIALSGMRFLFIKLQWFKKPLKWVYYLYGMVALVFLFRTGLLGGEMVYIHGVGIHKSEPAPVEKPSFEE
jgi:uncharacterized membrane protein